MSWNAIEEEKVIQKDLYPTKEGLTMGETLRVINEHSGGDAIIVTDVGQHQMVACRYAKFNQSKSTVTSGGLELWDSPSLQLLELNGSTKTTSNRHYW